MIHRYSRIAMSLHWLIAIALAFQIGLGWGLEHLSRQGFALYQLHKSIGVTILVLTLLRIAVRYWKPRPAPLEGGFNGGLAKAVHAGLYLFMLGAPLTGWALVSTAKIKVPTVLFGVLPLPHLPLPAASHGFFEGSHGLLAWLGIALLALHVAGALRHQLLIRDGLIWRMVPGRSVALMVALMAAIPAAFLFAQSMIRSAQGTAQGAAPAAAVPEGNSDNAAATAPDEPAVRAEEQDNAASQQMANAADNAQAATDAPVPSWIVQPGGHLDFSVGNGGSAVKGSFSRWTAKIAMDPDRPETADIRVNIDLASVGVGDATQNEMLAGDEFFATAAHPRATFVAKGAKRVGKGYTARGTLTLKGIKRPQTIAFTLAGPAMARKVSGSASIARAPFDIGMGESGGGLDPAVAIDFSFEAKGKVP